tara:strand:- start:4246 stop:5022 length:777 start_codon:yes stop_codon:yes gene_type:complete
MNNQYPLTIYVLGLGIDEKYMKKYKSLTINERTQYIYYDQTKDLNYYEQYIVKYSEKVNLVGFSMGCIVCLHLLETYHYLVNNIVLVGIPSIFYTTFNLQSSLLTYKSNQYNMYLPLKYNIQKTFLFNSFVSLLQTLDFVPFGIGTYFKKQLYKLMNPTTPDKVVTNICDSSLYKTLTQVHSHLVSSNVLSIIRKSKKKIHYLVGKEDDFAFVSSILSENTNNSILHLCHECNHHLFYFEPNYLYNRISIILRNGFHF